MRRIENKKAVQGVWLLTLPSNQQNNPESHSSGSAFAAGRAEKLSMIVGLAVSRGKLLSLWRRSHWKLIGKPEK